MSEKIHVGLEYDDDEEASQLTSNLPEHQYSRDQLISISKSPLSGRRPKCLDPLYDADDGKWDPDRWYKAQFELSGDVSPLNLPEGKERRRLTDLERDLKRRHSSVNDPVERLKEERDGIVLSPQRRSFGTGCHVQTTLTYSRQLTVPDRDEPRSDKDRERDRPVRKIGSGRIQIDRENSRDYSGLRDRFDDRDPRDRDRDSDRDRDFNWSREREWEREVRERDRDGRETEWDRDRDRDRRFDRLDRFRRDFPDRDKRDRDFRDRGFERNSRRRNNYREEEKVPEWFAGGPSSQTDTIELRGFDREGTCDSSEHEGKGTQKNERIKINTPSEISSKESSEEAAESDVKVSECSSPEEDQQVIPNESLDHHAPTQENQQEDHPVETLQQGTEVSPSPGNKYFEGFDFDEILKASIPPLQDEVSVCQGSRFSRFFSGINGSKLGSDASLEDTLVPRDLLEDSHNSPGLMSPTPGYAPVGVLPPQLGPAPHGLLHFQEQLDRQNKEHMFATHQSLLPVPSSAGDNNASLDKSALPPVVTALFSSAALGGSNASTSSNSSFSTQDAEAQLKAMLFGGHRDSAPSSGTASPASLPTSVQRKVKTVAELEADMHQNSPQKSISGMSVASSGSNPASTEDMAAFNKLLILINAASEASQNLTQTEPQTTRAVFGVVPSHNEFSHAVLRNKEEQMQLQQQSMHITQQAGHSHQPPLPPPPPPLLPPPPPLRPQLPPHLPPPPHIHSHQQMLPLGQQPPPLPPPQSLVSQQVHSTASCSQQLQKSQALQQQLHHHHHHQQQQSQQQQQNSIMNHHKQLSGLMNKTQMTPGLQQTMASHPNSVIRPRAQSGGPLVSADPIYSLIQQNPTIVMNPASPGPSMAAILASQQAAGPSTARIPSPLMFSQQPPLHLNAPSPIHPSQLSPRSLTIGTNLTTGAIASPTGMRSPVLHRGMSPQELSAHAQAVMQSALIKQQLHDQSERYQKKQQERAKSSNQQQLNAAKSQPTIQHATLPVQAKGLPVNTFLPTSVLRKMHSDKVLEKEKLAMEGKGDEKPELVTSMRELSGDSSDFTDSLSVDSLSRKSDHRLLGDLSDISFLDPVNPELVAMSNQLESQLRIGQTNILPGSLSYPMSVEEKMKLSALAEKPGLLSQILDKSAKATAAVAETARTSHGRPIVKGHEPAQTTTDDRTLQQHFFAMQQQQPPPPLLQGGRPVTGGSPKIQPSSFVGVPVVQPSLTPLSNLQQSCMSKPVTGGRAIVGGNSNQQQQSQVSMVSAQNLDMLRLLDLQRLQQMPHSQGMVLPPPPIRAPLTCLGPPPVAVPVSACIPVVGGPVPVSAANAGVLHQQIVRAKAMNAQHNQQISHFMAMHQAQQHRKVTPLPSLHMVMPGVSAPLSPRGQASGPLSPAALSATIQRVASPHGNLKINGPLTPATANGASGPKVDVNSGIQRWFSPDILKNQLPSMPPLPAKGNQVMTVDELEGN